MRGHIESLRKRLVELFAKVPSTSDLLVLEDITNIKELGSITAKEMLWLTLRLNYLSPRPLFVAVIKDSCVSGTHTEDSELNCPFFLKKDMSISFHRTGVMDNRTTGFDLEILCVY